MNKYYRISIESPSRHTITLMEIWPYLFFIASFIALQVMLHKFFVSLFVPIFVLVSIKLITYFRSKNKVMNEKHKTLCALEDYHVIVNGAFDDAITEDFECEFNAVTTYANYGYYSLTDMGIAFVNRIFKPAEKFNQKKADKMLSFMREINDHCDMIYDRIQCFKDLNKQLISIYEFSCKCPVQYDENLFSRADPCNISEQYLEHFKQKMSEAIKNISDPLLFIIACRTYCHVVFKKQVLVDDVLFDHIALFNELDMIWHSELYYLRNQNLKNNYKIARRLIIDDLGTVCRSEKLAKFYYNVFDDLKQ